MLVGYGTEVKGYRFFDPGRSKVFYSRDVKFNELEFGLKECRDVEPIGYFKVVNDSDVLEEIGAEETMPDQVVTETEPRRTVMWYFRIVEEDGWNCFSPRLILGASEKEC